MAQRSAKDMLRSLPTVPGFAEGGEVKREKFPYEIRYDPSFSKERAYYLDHKKYPTHSKGRLTELGKKVVGDLLDFGLLDRDDPRVKNNFEKRAIRWGMPEKGDFSFTKTASTPGRLIQIGTLTKKATPEPVKGELGTPSFSLPPRDVETEKQEDIPVSSVKEPSPPPPPPPPPPAPIPSPTPAPAPAPPPQNLTPVAAPVEITPPVYAPPELPPEVRAPEEPAARVSRPRLSPTEAQMRANLTPGVGVDLGFGYFDRLGNYIPAAKIAPVDTAEERRRDIPVSEVTRPETSIADIPRPVSSEEFIGNVLGSGSGIPVSEIPVADIPSVYNLRPMDPMGDLSLPQNRNLMPGAGVDTSQGYYDRLGNFIAAPQLNPLGVGTTPVFGYREGGEVDAFIKRANGGSASSSGVRRLKMSGYQAGGDVTDEMFLGTRPTDETTSPGILPPELREAIDVPLDLANLAIRGTAGAVAGPAYGLYKGITGGKYGTREGVTEARSEAERMMGEITGEPKTQAAKDIMQSLGETMEEAKIPPMPQFLTTPVPGPGAASALMRSYELAETPPLGTVKLAGDKGVKPATPPTDQMGFYSPAEKAVMGLPQDKGTASQMLAQITKTQGVKPVELRATGLEDYLKGKGNEPVTKQEIQDFLTNNRVQVDEVVLGRGLSMSPEAKRLMGDAEKRMMEADQVMAPFFEQQEAGSLLQGQEPYSTFYRIRGPLSRKIAKGDQEALAELDALNLPPDIRQAVLDFGSAKLDYQKHSKPARFEQKPKFDGYNIPGGQNAREIYLTLPGKTVEPTPFIKSPATMLFERDMLEKYKADNFSSIYNRLSPDEVDKYGMLVREDRNTAKTESMLRDKQTNYTVPSAHSVSPEADRNRLAHIFLDERQDAKGNNVLFVQELQSDWAQTGRDKGFAKTYTPDQLKAEEVLPKPPGPPVWRVTYPDGNQSTFAANTANEAIASAIQREGTIGSPPSAPFVTNTEDWVNLALKRVIKEAVDNDIDTVAFIKGGQAADKYSLRTFVDYIAADRKTTSGDDLYVSINPKDSLNPHNFYVGPDGVIKEPISADVRSKFLGEPLSKVIGKEAAEKLLSTKTGESQILRDEGLALGGKGMEGFYDNVLPKTANKLLKRLGGDKVEQVDIGSSAEKSFGVSFDTASKKWEANLDNKPIGFFASKEEAQAAAQAAYDKEKTSYLGFKITPEMKEMVRTEGLPKFAAGGEVTDFIKRAA